MIHPVSWDGSNNLVIRIVFDRKSFVTESTVNDGVLANITGELSEVVVRRGNTGPCS